MYAPNSIENDTANRIKASPIKALAKGLGALKYSSINENSVKNTPKALKSDTHILPSSFILPPIMCIKKRSKRPAYLDEWAFDAHNGFPPLFLGHASFYKLKNKWPKKNESYRR